MSTMRTVLTNSSISAERICADIGQFGFYSPIPLLAPAECRMVEQYFAMPDLPRPLTWFKGHAAVNAAVYEIATRRKIIALLQPLLGNDIVLWGAMLVRRAQYTRHVWHSDLDTAAPHCRAISIWIGLRNTSDTSGLRFVTRSHLFGRSAQEVMAELNVDRNLLTDERMLQIARTMDPAAQIARAGHRDGDMVLFDGRVWHSGYNEGTRGTRTALLLQYAAADNPIPMPANLDYTWPWKTTDTPRVPTILVSGSARNSVNRIVPAPMPPLKEALAMITTVAKSVALPLAENTVKRWQAYPQFSGRTAALNIMSCHVSVLSAGHRPHPPHIHPEEELLVMLDGEVAIELADDPNSTGSSRHPVRPGTFSYYPATQHHTIHNVGARPATYLMFKWYGGAVDNDAPLPARIFEYGDTAATPEPKPMAQKLVFQQGTHSLAKLHCHLTTLQPGTGYAAHADPYDVAIVLLSGEVETVGARVRPLGLMYYSAGQLHGMKNIGNTPASYLVFEFHSAPHNAPPPLKTPERIKRGIGRRLRHALRLVTRRRP